MVYFTPHPTYVEWVLADATFKSAESRIFQKTNGGYGYYDCHALLFTVYLSLYFYIWHWMKFLTLSLRHLSSFESIVWTLKRETGGPDYLGPRTLNWLSKNIKIDHECEILNFVFLLCLMPCCCWCKRGREIDVCITSNEVKYVVKEREFAIFLRIYPAKVQFSSHDNFQKVM